MTKALAKKTHLRQEDDDHDGKHRQTNISTFFISAKTAVRRRPKVQCPTVKHKYASSSSQRALSSSSKASSSSSLLAQSKTLPKKKSTQLYLDLGQKSFAKRTVCGTCGMLFVHGTSDIHLHEKQCQSYKDGVSFHNNKTARFVTGVLSEGERECKIVEIRSSDSAALRKKAEAVRLIAHAELGFVTDTTGQFRTTFLFVKDHRVVGMLAVEPVAKAYVLLTETLERCTEPTSVTMGIHTIWTHARYRGKQIASRLLDAARTKFLYGTSRLALAQIAFSSPTQAGIRFATSYLRREQGLQEEDGTGAVKLLIYESS